METHGLVVRLKLDTVQKPLGQELHANRVLLVNEPLQSEYGCLRFRSVRGVPFPVDVRPSVVVARDDPETNLGDALWNAGHGSVRMHQGESHGFGGSFQNPWNGGFGQDLRSRLGVKSGHDGEDMWLRAEEDPLGAIAIYANGP